VPRTSKDLRCNVGYLKGVIRFSGVNLACRTEHATRDLWGLPSIPNVNFTTLSESEQNRALWPELLTPQFEIQLELLSSTAIDTNPAFIQSASAKRMTSKYVIGYQNCIFDLVSNSFPLLRDIKQRNIRNGRHIHYIWTAAYRIAIEDLGTRYSGPQNDIPGPRAM
jgi:hypothetical protein